MSGKYTSGGGVKPGGGDGKETRDAQDDAAMRTYLGEIRDLIAAQANAAAVSAMAAQDYPRYEAPGSFYRADSASPAGVSAPAPAPADAIRPDPVLHNREVEPPPPFGPEGPHLKSTYQEPEPAPGSRKHPYKPQDDPASKGTLAAQARDYTPKFDEMIRLLGQMRGFSATTAAAAQASNTNSGAASDSTTTDDGSGNVTTHTTKQPSLGGYSQAYSGGFHGIGRSEFGPDFDYGTRAYPWTNVAGRFEALGRFARNNIPGLQVVASAGVQSMIDYDAIMRPSRDRNPYAILKGRNALNERIEAARYDLESHQNIQLPAGATDQEKSEHHDALKKKQTVLDALEAHKQSRADSVKWAESATEQMSGTAVGKLAAKIGRALGNGDEEIDIARAATAASLFKGAALAALIAVLQFEGAALQWAASGRQVGLQQAAALGQYGMATPIAGDLARFGVARMMRDIQVGYDVSESSQRFLRYATDVEMRSRNADAANVRMGNQAATFRMGMFDELNAIRRPFDDLWERHTNNEKFDRSTSWAGRRATDFLVNPLYGIYKLLKGDKEEEKTEIPESPWLKYIRAGAEVGPAKLSPPIPPPPVKP